MVGIAAFGLGHVNDQVTFFIASNIFFEFFDEDTIAFEVVDHIEGFLGIIVLVETHWDDVVVWEEFWTTVFHTSNDFSIWADQFIFSFWIFSFIETTQVEVETHLKEFVWILVKEVNAAEDSIASSLIGFLVGFWYFNGVAQDAVIDSINPCIT